MNLNEIEENREKIKQNKIQDIKNDQQRFIKGLQECFYRTNTCGCKIISDNVYCGFSNPFKTDIVESVLPDIEKSGIAISYTKEFAEYEELLSKIHFTLPVSLNKSK